MTPPPKHAGDGSQWNNDTGPAGYPIADQQAQDGYRTAGYQQPDYSTTSQQTSGQYPPPAPPQDSGYAYDPQGGRPAYPPPVPPRPPRTVNGWAVAALICAIYAPIVGIILACVAYQDSQRDGVGRKLAKAALIVSIISSILTLGFGVNLLDTAEGILLPATGF